MIVIFNTVICWTVRLECLSIKLLLFELRRFLLYSIDYIVGILKDNAICNLS